MEIEKRRIIVEDIPAIIWGRNSFHASMLVRYANDGKLYLYDIIDIKKETSNPLGE